MGAETLLLGWLWHDIWPCIHRLYCVLIMLVWFVLRTSVSVHLMEWSPDGEYFATAGKVREQAKKWFKQNNWRNPYIHFQSVFHKFRQFSCTACLRYNKNVCEAGDLAQWWPAVVTIGEVLSSSLSSVKWMEKMF